MQDIKKIRRECLNERGIGLFMVAASLVVLLGVGALAVDLEALYVARSEAQRAADSSALAAASKLIESGFTSGFVTQATAENLARLEAITIGGQNTVGGDPAVIAAGDVVFDFSSPENPLVTVTVRRTAATNNPMPTFFAKVFGILEVDVTAAATAEAFNPSGGGAAIGTDCIKPWILPNCDPVNAGPSSASCSGGEAPFVDNVTGAIINPGTVIGTPLLLKAGDPTQAAAPSQFYPIQIPPGTEPALCPDCTGPEPGSDGPGAALYRHNIECCNTNILVCGQTVDIDLSTGNMVGPTQLGVRCLIHQSANGTGQDILTTSTTPFQITGGTNNPNPGLVGQTIAGSDSIITIPLYDGHDLCPGGSCGFTITIVGFLQVFINDVDNGAQGTVNATIINVAGCGGGGGGAGGGGSGGGDDGGGGGAGSGTGGTGSGSGGAVITTGGSLFPVRLVRPTN